MRELQNSDGREARREIKRRQMTGYCDGTAIEVIDAKAEVETESRIGTVITYTKGSR